MVSRQDVSIHGAVGGATAGPTAIQAAATFQAPVLSAYPPGAPGTYKPDNSTVGFVPAGQLTLTTYPTTGGPLGDIISSKVTVTTPGVDVSGYQFFCRVIIKAANITIRKSKIRGDIAETISADVALLDCTDSACVNMLLEDSHLIPDAPSLFMNGIRGHDFTVQRSNIDNVTDGIDTFNNANPGGNMAINILANWIHDLSGFGPDTPNSRPFTHNDCVQIIGGTGIVVRGNAFEGMLNMAIGQAQDDAFNPNIKQNPSPSNSVLQVTQNGGDVRGLIWDKNWHKGGSVTLNVSGQNGTAGNCGSFTNNFFDHDCYFQGGAAVNDGVPGAGGDNCVVFSSKLGFTFTAPAASVPTGGSGVVDPNGNNRFADNNNLIKVRLA